jgi:hypothetical protein
MNKKLILLLTAMFVVGSMHDINAVEDNKKSKNKPVIGKSFKEHLKLAGSKALNVAERAHPITLAACLQHKFSNFCKNSNIGFFKTLPFFGRIAFFNKDKQYWTKKVKYAAYAGAIIAMAYTANNLNNRSDLQGNITTKVIPAYVSHWITTIRGLASGVKAVYGFGAQNVSNVIATLNPNNLNEELAKQDKILASAIEQVLESASSVEQVSDLVSRGEGYDHE